MRYEIDSETYAISVYDDNEVKFAFQPEWPDGTPWASAEQATAWAEQLLVSIQDLTAPMPGPNPGTPVVSRPAEVPTTRFVPPGSED